MAETKFQIFKRQKPWKDAFYYQKTEVLYQMTFVFCKRFLPPYGDRTVDQMVQAARSGKQNIIEGTEDGLTSIELYLKLLNIARSSIQELKEDYCDFLKSRNLSLWNNSHSRFKRMQDFCRSHNKIEDYQPFFEKWNAEEMANIAITLCYMVDAMINKSLKFIEKEFVQNGGIKEKMYSARTGFRQKREEEIYQLQNRIRELESEIYRLKKQLKE